MFVLNVFLPKAESGIHMVEAPGAEGPCLLFAPFMSVGL